MTYSGGGAAGGGWRPSATAGVKGRQLVQVVPQRSPSPTPPHTHLPPHAGIPRAAPCPDGSHRVWQKRWDWPAIVWGGVRGRIALL